MKSISPVRDVERKSIEKNQEGVEIYYCIWEGCVEAKWIQIAGVYLVHPKFVKLFKQRHKLA